MSGPARTPPNTLTGIALLVAAVACFALQDMGMIAVCGAAGAWLAVRESRILNEVSRR